MGVSRVRHILSGGAPTWGHSNCFKSTAYAKVRHHKEHPHIYIAPTLHCYVCWGSVGSTYQSALLRRARTGVGLL